MSLLPRHQAHDPRELMRRWQAVAKAVGTRVQTLAVVGGEKIGWLETRPQVQDAFYLSAGVHGDEAAAAWGLLFWAEAHLEWLQRHACLIVPCFNPHGLRANTRTDHRGCDLNRCFHLDDDPVIGPWRRLVIERTWRVGLCLHEDYDAQGCYVYELSHHSHPVAREILPSITALPPDVRRSIDGRRAAQGIIRRRHPPVDLPGLPEAIVLHELGCPVTLTFETPSEFGWNERVLAHQQFIAQVMDHPIFRHSDAS